MHAHKIQLLAALLAITATSTASAQAGSGLMSDLSKDVSDVRQKLVGLVKTIPADKYDWRPGPGVRSVREVFLHVASDNYLLPSAFGVPIDPATGIVATDFTTLGKFEKQNLGPDAVAAALEKSFDHLAKAMKETPDAKLAEHFKFFGQDFTGQRLWVLTTTHLHEHLGQAIAYARTNGVVPPWSK